MTKEEIHTSVNAGRRALLVLESIGPILGMQKDRLVNDLKNLYRSGSGTESKLLAVASGLCTIDDIESRLKAQIRQGESASEEVM